MKKLFSSIVAVSLSIIGINAFAEESASPEATPDANPTEATVSAPEKAAPVANVGKMEVPEIIVKHIDKRFPGRTIKGVTREGVTYVVDLGDGLHIRYDNCCNPICYGIHNHYH